MGASEFDAKACKHHVGGALLLGRCLPGCTEGSQEVGEAELDQQLPLQPHGDDVEMRQRLSLHKLEARDGIASSAWPVAGPLRGGCQG